MLTQAPGMLWRKAALGTAGRGEEALLSECALHAGCWPYGQAGRAVTSGGGFAGNLHNYGTSLVAQTVKRLSTM